MEIITKIGQIELLRSSCNPATIFDGRGGIFTWVTDHEIREFNLVYIKPNKIRGNHFHPEFIEYFLVVDGVLLLSTFDRHLGTCVEFMATSGMCFRTPIGTTHSFHCIKDATCVSLLTKPWDMCEKPIVSDVISTSQ
jgi:dTDP-4-dehydrorhamnose 3,5-epimerase-like enzyme